ncbi:MAG: TetR/AcrR family transcriptional regulator [Leifsonia xyli]|nr:MAG: TetR/AcrR family transcriptional regulator [Leifsonia xyli]
MRSAHTPPDDLTAAARIRDAAVRLFGARGYAHTSVREIATEAGVSPALVIHHFGSKESLREECDRWMLAQLDQAQADTRQPGRMRETIAGWLAAPEQFRPLVDYLATMLTDDGPHGRVLFDQLVAETRTILDAGVADQTMHESADPEARALLVTLHGLAPLLLRSHLERALGGDLLDSAVLARLTLPSLELSTDGLYRDSAMLDATRAALATASGSDPATATATPLPLPKETR